MDHERLPIYFFIFFSLFLKKTLDIYNIRMYSVIKMGNKQQPTKRGERK